MNISNAVNPSPEQFMAFLNSDFSGPVCMLNLLKFKEHATYADGRASPISGQQAYELYGEKMKAFVISKGGKFLFHGSAEHLIIGETETLWDRVAIVEYPSKEAFVAIATSDEVVEFAIHRSAGLEGQLLIATSAVA